MRDLHQHPGAVAHARVGAGGAAVFQIAENLQAIFDDLVRLAALDVGDEADAAGVLVERGVVEALAQRRAGIGGRAARSQTPRWGVCGSECARGDRTVSPGLGAVGEL